jgi:amino acid transporter
MAEAAGSQTASKDTSIGGGLLTEIQKGNGNGNGNGLFKTLGLADLLFFGITNILGSGASNLVGHAVVAAGSWWPAHIAGAAGLLLGSSKTYTDAAAAFQTNDAEGRLIESEMGDLGRKLASAMIVLFNIASTAIGLVFITRIFYPQANFAFQVMLALQFAILLIAIGLYGIEINKTIIDSIGALCIGVIGMFGILGLYKLFSTGAPQNMVTAVGSAFHPVRGFLYMFFILAGFDIIIKFTEETVEPANIQRAFYASNIGSAILLAGLCLAFVAYVPLRGMRNFNNVFGDIAKYAFGDGEAEIMKWVAAGFILISSLVNYVGVSRYIYSGVAGSAFEGWRELNAAKAPWKILLGLGAVMIGFICMNNIDKLIAVADLLLVGVLAAVSWSAARRALKEGKRPWIESGTTIGLFGVGGAAVWQLFQRVGHGYDTAN